MTDLYPIPGFDGYLINREGTRVRGRAGFDLSIRPDKTKSGRLVVKVAYKSRQVAQLVALTFHGPCPEGQELRHLDDNYLNNHADNLAYGTRVENVADSIRTGRHISCQHKAKTHCPQGHEYSEANTYWYTKKNGVTGRQCIPCSRESTKKWQERNREYTRAYARARGHPERHRSS